MIKSIPFVVKFYVFPKCLKSFKQHNQSTEEFCLSFPPRKHSPTLSLVIRSSLSS